VVVRGIGVASVEQTRQLDATVVAARSLEALYAQHAPGLRRRCRRLTHDPDAAEDLLQETFVRFMARFPEPPADMNVGGYLHATARNILWKQLRDEHEIADADIERSAGPDDDLEVDPERSALLVEQQGLVRRCSAVLTGRQRRALMLRDVEGRSYAEIGSTLGIGTDAVAQVISRARVRLRVAVRRAQVDLDQLSPECRAMLGPLSEYLDGRVAKGSPEIEQHLAGCESCRQSLAAFQAAGSRLRGALPFAPIAGVLARIGEVVRLGGGGPVDAVRAGSVVVAAALAIGGGGIYVAQRTSAPPAVQVSSAPSHAIDHSAARARSGAATTPDSGTTPRAAAGPAVARGRTVHDAVPRHRGRAPTAPTSTGTPATRPAATPTIPGPTPVASPPGTPAAPPATDPSGPPPASKPGAGTPKPPSHGTSPAGVTTPVNPAPGVTRTVDTVVTPAVTTVVKKVVDPVVKTVVDPVVSKVVVPVTDPVTKAIAPVTDPVAKAVAPVTDPVVKALAPVLPTVTAPAASPPNAPPAAPAPTTPAPAVTTPAISTPVVTVPAITLPGVGG
jgi:RNA polymerase sigma factor (sigma-70 family)